MLEKIFLNFLCVFIILNILLMCVMFSVFGKLQSKNNDYQTNFSPEFPDNTPATTEKLKEIDHCHSSEVGAQILAEKVLEQIKTHKDLLPYPHFEKFSALSDVHLSKTYGWDKIVKETEKWPLEKVIVIRIDTKDLCTIFNGPKPKQRYILMGRFDQNWGPLSTRFPWVGRTYPTVSERFHCRFDVDDRFHGKSAKEALLEFLAQENLLLWVGSQHTIIEHEKILSLPLGIVPRASEIIMKSMKEVMKK